MVESIQSNTHLTRKVDVVHGEWIMRLDALDIRDTDACSAPSRTCGWYCSLRHEAFFCSCLEKGANLYDNSVIATELLRSFARAYDHTAVAIGRLAVGSEAVGTRVLQRAEPL